MKGTRCIKNGGVIVDPRVKSWWFTQYLWRGPSGKLHRLRVCDAKDSWMLTSFFDGIPTKKLLRFPVL